MRLVLMAIGAYGVYHFLLRQRARRNPAALLSDMRRGGGERRGSEDERVTYVVVEHDGGWAYRVGDVFSETYATRSEAAAAAQRAAEAHQSAGADTIIEYQDAKGRWHEELESGVDRPETEVRQRPAPGG